MESRMKEREIDSKYFTATLTLGLAERIHLLSRGLETAGLAVIGCSQYDKINDI